MMNYGYDIGKLIKLSEAETAIFDNNYVEEISGSLSNSQLMVTSLFVFIPDINLFIRLGLLVDEYVPVTVVYRSEGTEEYVLLGKEDIVRTVYEICNGIKSYKEVEDMACYLSKIA